MYQQLCSALVCLIDYQLNVKSRGNCTQIIQFCFLTYCMSAVLKLNPFFFPPNLLTWKPSDMFFFFLFVFLESHTYLSFCSLQAGQKKFYLFSSGGGGCGWSFPMEVRHSPNDMWAVQKYYVVPVEYWPYLHNVGWMTLSIIPLGSEAVGIASLIDFLFWKML